MKWSEVKRAVEQAGVKDDDEIVQIECEPNGGSKEFHKVTIGHLVRLRETESDEERRRAAGCAV